MKPLPTLILSLIVSVGIAGCESKQHKPIDFHVRINCFNVGDEWSGEYVIEYTNDGWENVKEINTTFTLEGVFNDTTDVCYQPYLTDEKSQAILLAKRFTSYNMITHYQDSVYRLYLYRRNRYKPTPKPKVITKKSCCQITNIK